MEQKVVEIDGKKYEISEIKYVDAAGLDRTDEKKANLQMFKLSGISEEQLAELSLKAGYTLSKEIIEFNGLDDFQKPVIEKK